MSLQLRLVALGGALAAALAATPAPAQITAAPGWAVSSIDTPGDVQGGVVRSGDAILVGQGAFGAGQMSIIRLEGVVATTIATGFNALGGFALDDAGTLFVADNGGNLAGAATGDTVFAIPNALTRTTALPAVGAEVVPAGSIPFAQDVALDGADLVVSDAVGPPAAGRVVRVSNGMVTDVVTGLAYAAGVIVDGTRLLVGNVDASFVGSVTEYTLGGMLVGPVVGGLGGNYTHVLDNDGNVLVSGGFTDDFSSSTVIAVAPGGAVSERASGFTFSSEMFHDAVRDETLVLDVGVGQVTVTRVASALSTNWTRATPVTGAGAVDRSEDGSPALAAAPGCFTTSATSTGCPASAAAQDASLTASVDRSTIRENESFTYVLRAEGRIAGEPDVSALEQDFDVLNRSTSARIAARTSSARRETWTSSSPGLATVSISAAVLPKSFTNWIGPAPSGRSRICASLSAMSSKISPVSVIPSFRSTNT